MRDNNRRLKVELELTKEEIKNVYQERERAKEVRQELEHALEEVAVLRTALQTEASMKQSSFDSFFAASPVGGNSPQSDR